MPKQKARTAQLGVMAATANNKKKEDSSGSVGIPASISSSSSSSSYIPAINQQQVDVMAVINVRSSSTSARHAGENKRHKSHKVHKHPTSVILQPQAPVQDKSAENIEKECVHILLKKQKAWEETGRLGLFIDFVYVEDMDAAVGLNMTPSPTPPAIKLPSIRKLGSTISATEEAIDEFRDRLASLAAGSHQWGAEAKKLAIKAALLDFSKRIDEDGIYASLRNACDFVSGDVMGITTKNLKLWVREWLTNNTISEPPSRMVVRPLNTPRQLTTEYIMEILAFCADRLRAGIIVNSTTIQRHLKGNVRLHHLLTIDLCPPLEVENAVISTTMASVGGIAWGEIKRVGKLKGDGDIEEAIEKKNWRTLVSVVDYIRALKMERAGVAVIASGDESYCHTLHHADQSYLLIGKENVSKHEVNCAVRDGLRICMQMFTTRWGPIALDDIVDCKFLNAAGDEDGPGARMKEMDQDGELRQVYRAAPRGVGEKPVSQMNKNQLQTKAIELGVSIYAENGTTELTKESLKKAIQAFRAIGRAEVADARAAKDRTGGLGGILTAEQKARQLIETDWEELFDQYKDCALTTIRFMIAYQHCGDYHDNYDHPMFFKHLVVLYLVYPRWCMQQQRKLEAGTLYPATIHPFFKWSNAEKTAGTPARQL